MLSKEKIKELEQKLNERKAIITEELKKFAVKSKDIKDNYETVFPQYGSDYDENALEVSDYETNLALEHRLELDLAQINAALEKIKKGTYGICENCHQEIEIRRLEAFPEARFCLKCKETKGNKQKT